MSWCYFKRLSWALTIAAGLGGTLAACSSKEEPSAVSPEAMGQAQTFRFAPPDGTQYVRTDRRMQEVSIVGAPLRRIDNEELRWQVDVDRNDGTYEVSQDLAYISLSRDGETLIQGKVPSGISAKLVIDESGDLTDVKGLEKTSEVLRSLVAPGKEAAAAQVITPQSLGQAVAWRYKVLFGETIGRPATPGSTWTITNPPGSFVSSRTVTVERQEACDSATCARLKVDFKLDPRVMAQDAVSMVQSRVLAAGGDPSKVKMRSASYGMTGWMLVEPATMLSHGAALTEGGTVTVADPSQQELTVQIKGSTELSYQYGAAPAAARPAPRAKARLAAE